MEVNNFISLEELNLKNWDNNCNRLFTEYIFEKGVTDFYIIELNNVCFSNDIVHDAWYQNSICLLLLKKEKRLSSSI